jgi:histidine decarboxylase
MLSDVLDSAAPAPATTPCQVYPPVQGITCPDFQLPTTGLTQVQVERALLQVQNVLGSKKQFFLGFQANQNLDFADLSPYLNFHVNNIGDAFQQGNFGVNNKWMERAVLDYFARLWNIDWPHRPGDRPHESTTYWGYVLAMGSTEGNLYGLWNARDYLSGKILLHDPHLLLAALRARRDGLPEEPPGELLYVQAPLPAGRPPEYFEPIAFYSDSTHYSIVKILRVLGIPGVEIPSAGGPLGSGAIDIPALAAKVEEYAAKQHPILLCLNYGTTFKGAYDDVEKVGQALLPIFARYGQDRRIIENPPYRPVERTGYWFHVDGALGAAHMPFLEMTGATIPQFDFRLPFVHSIAMSGHKWIGAPWPCGIYMTRTKYQLSPSSAPGYIGAADSTFAGSRNGFSAMILWYYLARNSYNDQRDKARRLDTLASYTFNRLQQLQRERWPNLDLQIARSPQSLTVLFRQAHPRIVAKYSLSNDRIVINGQTRFYSHVFLMDHVREGLINQLIVDLQAPDAFTLPPAPPLLAQVAEELLAPELLARMDLDAVSLPDLAVLGGVPVAGRGFQ